MLGVKGCVGKNSTPTSTRDKATIEYISERQPSSYELAFGVELGPNPHSKRIAQLLEAGYQICNIFKMHQQKENKEKIKLQKWSL